MVIAKFEINWVYFIFSFIRTLFFALENSRIIFQVHSNVLYNIGNKNAHGHFTLNKVGRAM